QPGDLVVWGPSPGHHVALVLEAGDDPLLASNGQDKGPIAIRFSLESKYQPAQVTWLSCLPWSGRDRCLDGTRPGTWTGGGLDRGRSRDVAVVDVAAARRRPSPPRSRGRP